MGGREGGEGNSNNCVLCHFSGAWYWGFVASHNMASVRVLGIISDD